MLFRKKKKSPSAPSRQSLEISGQAIPYDLIRSDRRTLSIQVKRNGHVIVRAPRHMADAEITHWIVARQTWIKKHRARFAEIHTPPLRYVIGEEHFFLGDPLVLKIVVASRSDVQIKDDDLVVKTRFPYDSAKTKALLKAFYHSQALNLFPSFIAEAFPPFAAMGYAIPSLKLRWMKRHWGSLSAKGIMTLNTKLIRAPRHLIDYVILHELCHLKHMDHGPEFYNLMNSMMVDWKARKKALVVFMA